MGEFGFKQKYNQILKLSRLLEIILYMSYLLIKIKLPICFNTFPIIELKEFTHFLLITTRTVKLINLIGKNV